MKTIKWNIGIFVIRIGYLSRLYDFKPLNFSIRWEIGKLILNLGYALRGDIPQKMWKGNHI